MMRAIAILLFCFGTARAQLGPEQLVLFFGAPVSQVAAGFSMPTNHLYFFHYSDSFDSLSPTNGHAYQWWVDSSGNGNVATNPTLSTSPVWTNKMLGFQSNVPHRLRYTGASALDFTRNATNGLTVFVACVPRTPWTQQLPWVASVGGANITRFGMFVGLVSNRFSVGVRRLDADTFQAIHSGVALAAYPILAATLSTSGVGVIYQDGVEVGRSNALVSAGATANTASFSQWIGTFNGSFNYNGEIHLVAGYRAALPSNEVFSISTNIAHHWALRRSS